MDSQPITHATELGDLIDLTRRLEATAETLVSADDFLAARDRVARRLRAHTPAAAAHHVASRHVA